MRSAISVVCGVMAVLVFSSAPLHGDESSPGDNSMATVTSSIPEAGSKAPEFTLQDSTGKDVNLKELANKKAVVLYFYPKADTPGCTKEACSFRDAISQFRKMDVTVLGVSPDPVEDIRKFSEKYSLPFPLLADADHQVSQAYGVWREKESGGRKYWGVVRTTFVIQGGKIVHVFEKVKPEGHDEEVLAWLKENGGR
jgi:thioredoxin-dependent peroxiredoxin